MGTLAGCLRNRANGYGGSSGGGYPTRLHLDVFNSDDTCHFALLPAGAGTKLQTGDVPLPNQDALSSFMKGFAG